MVNRVHKMEIAKQSSEKAWKMPFGVCPLYGVHFTRSDPVFSMDFSHFREFDCLLSRFCTVSSMDFAHFRKFDCSSHRTNLFSDMVFSQFYKST